MGLSSSVVPLYVGEVAPVARRGSLVGLYQLAFSFGLLLAQVPSEAAGDMDLDDETAMRVAHALLALPALLLLLLGGRYLHDSPRSLLLLGRPDDARAALKHLYAGVDDGDRQLEAELEYMQSAVAAAADVEEPAAGGERGRCRRFLGRLQAAAGCCARAAAALVADARDRSAADGDLAAVDGALLRDALPAAL